MHPQIDQVRCMAGFVRRELEQLTLTQPFISSPSFSPRDLGGYCGIGSHVLARCLRYAGVRTQIRHGERKEGGGHVWLVIEGTEIAVDITATQFGPYPPVFIFNQGDEPGWVTRSQGLYVRGFLKRWGPQSPHEPEYKEALRDLVASACQKYRVTWRAIAQSRAA